MDRREFVTLCMALPVAKHIAPVEPIDEDADFLFSLYRVYHGLNFMRPDADLMRRMNEIEAELGAMGYRIVVKPPA